MSEISAEVGVADLADLLDTTGTDVSDLTVEVGLWVDSSERLGRISYVLDMEEMAEADTELPEVQREQLAEVLSGVELGIVIEFYDYEDPGIAVEFPTDATDLTDELDD
jgi:hypothetical protein